MYEVNAYSLTDEGSLKLSANFVVREFKCNDGSNVVLISPKLVQTLQAIRDNFKVPVRINSAYRTTGYNKQIGGATNSNHTFGLAADITVDNIQPNVVARYAAKLLGNTGGVIQYPNFVHVDMRKIKYRAKTGNGKTFVSVSEF